MKKGNVFKLLCIALLFIFSSCSTVQETGRTSLMLFSVEEEQQMGKQSYAQIMSESKLSTDKTMNARLNAVASRIITAVGDSAPAGTEWEYHVIDDDQVNAFAVPGGKIAVYSGLMKIATDEELAYVVGHEIAHVTARHGAERMSQQTVVSLVGSLVSSSMKSSTSAMLFEVAYGLGANVGILLPYSRKNEYEADEIGSLYAARAGYNPEGGISMLNKLKTQSGNSGTSIEYLSTHPLDDNRIAALQKIMPNRMELYTQNARK